MLSILPYFLINVSLIFLEIYFRNLICCSILPISSPKAFSLKSAALLAGIWTAKNYVLSSGMVWGDILSILVFLTVLPLAVEKGYRLKGLLTSIIFITIEVAMMNVVAMVAFPVAESLGYSSLTLVDVKSSFGNAVMVLICLPAVLIPTWIAGRLLKKSFSDREFSFWILCFLPIPIS